MNKKKSIKLNFVMNALLNMSSFIFPLITFPYVYDHERYERARRKQGRAQGAPQQIRCFVFVFFRVDRNGLRMFHARPLSQHKMR